MDVYILVRQGLPEERGYTRRYLSSPGVRAAMQSSHRAFGWDLLLQTVTKIELKELLIQVLPLWVCISNQSLFPTLLPNFEHFFSLDCTIHIFM